LPLQIILLITERYWRPLNLTVL